MTSEVKAPEWPAIGSKWRENRTGLVKQVIAYDRTYRKIRLKGVRKTWANLLRFDGSPDGYTRVD